MSNTPPIDKLRELPPREIVVLAKKLAQELVNGTYLACENKTDMDNAHLLNLTLGTEMVCKIISTKVMNEVKALGKSETACIEVSRVMVTDLVVAMTQICENHIKGMFNGESVEQKHKLRRD